VVVKALVGTGGVQSGGTRGVRKWRPVSFLKKGDRKGRARIKQKGRDEAGAQLNRRAAHKKDREKKVRESVSEKLDCAEVFKLETQETNGEHKKEEDRGKTKEPESMKKVDTTRISQRKKGVDASTILQRKEERRGKKGKGGGHERNKKTWWERS